MNKDLLRPGAVLHVYQAIIQPPEPGQQPISRILVCRDAITAIALLDKGEAIQGASARLVKLERLCSVDAIELERLS